MVQAVEPFDYSMTIYLTSTVICTALESVVEERGEIAVISDYWPGDRHRRASCYDYGRVYLQEPFSYGSNFML